MKIGGSPSRNEPRSGETVHPRRSPDPSAPSAGKPAPAPKVSEPLSRSVDTLLKLWKLSPPIGEGKILERLASLPARERMDALSVQLILAKRNISLDEGEWNRLWSLVKEGKSLEDSPRKGEDILEREPAGNGIPPGEPEGEAALFRIFRDGGGRGSAAVTLEEGRLTSLIVRLSRQGRRWEFVLSRMGSEKRDDSMAVYTDDKSLIRNPPPSWENFRRALSGYGIFVERTLKSIMEDDFFSDTDSREPGRLVDFIL